MSVEKTQAFDTAVFADDGSESDRTLDTIEESSAGIVGLNFVDEAIFRHRGCPQHRLIGFMRSG